MRDTFLQRAQDLVLHVIDRVRGVTADSIDAVASAAANKTMWVGAWSGMMGWAADINWLGLLGFMVALGGMVANIYFARRRDAREAAESAARIEALRSRCGL